MFQDALAWHAFWRESEGWVVGSFLQRIWQIAPEDYLLAFYRPPGRSTSSDAPRDLRLRLSLAPGQPFVHPWLDDKPPAQLPSSFCMLLRKHCMGKPITALYRAGLERLVGLVFPDSVLVIELWDRRPNLLLCRLAPEGLGKILGGHRLGHFERKLVPGQVYQPPGATDAPLPDASSLTAAELQALEGSTPREVLLDRLFGLSPSAVQELLRRCGLRGDDSWGPDQRTALAGAWGPFWEDFQGRRWRPGVTPKQRLTCWGGPQDQPVESMFAGAALLGKSQGDGAAPDHWLKVGSAPLHRSLQAALKRNLRKIEALEGDLAKVSQIEPLQEKAELLLAYQHQLGEQDGPYQLPRFDGSGDLEIPRESGLSPVEQAQHYYRQVKRYRRSQSHLEPRVAGLRQERRDLEELQAALQRVQTPAELESIRLRLSTGASEKAARTVEPAGKKGPRRYRHGQVTLLVGRNPRQNDLLLTRLATREDLWFHVRDGAGAHVLLKGAGASPDMEAIEAAAVLAARHSSRKMDSKVEIVFLPAHKVKKPPGSPPGYVTYRNEMSLTVDPQQQVELVDESEGQ